MINSALLAEDVNANRLKKVLIEARKKLKQDLQDVDSINEFQRVVKASLDRNIKYINTLDAIEWDRTYQQGMLDGKLLVGESGNIPNNSSYWGWYPNMPINALQVSQAEYADKITKMKEDLQQKIFKTAQVNIALGYDLNRTMKDVLGEGLKGVTGKDGVFRSAVFRAEMIARSISNELINKGAITTYKQVDKISPSLSVKKVWSTVSDNRTSKVCNSLKGQIKRLDEDFVSPYNNWTGEGAPAHPFCRSRVTCVTDKYSAKVEQEFRDYTNSNEAFNALKPLISKPDLQAPERTSRNSPLGLKDNVYSLNPAIGNQEIDQILFNNLNPETYKALNGFIKDNDIKLIYQDLGKYTEPQNLKHLMRNIPDTAIKFNGSFYPTTPEQKLSLLLLEGNSGFTYDGFNTVVIARKNSNGYLMKVNPARLKNSISEAIGNENTIKHFSLGSSLLRDYPDEYSTSVMLHELGHSIAYKAKHSGVPTGAKNVSTYATVDDQEWFAESFLAYSIAPDTLQKYDSITYNYIREVMVKL